MPGRWFWNMVILTGLVVPLISGSAEAADRVQQTRTNSDNRPYLAVMGEIQNAGAYELPRSPRLWELLKQAGGLRQSATGEVHIVRGDRVAIRTHISTGLQTPLQQGDVVVLPGRRMSSRKPAPVESSIEVCLQNIADYPVVLQLRPRHANLKTLIGLLKQPLDSVRGLRVIGRTSRNSQLHNGTILIFDPRSVHLDSVPALPQPILLTENRSDDMKQTQAIRTAALTQPLDGPTLRRVEILPKKSDDVSPPSSAKSRVQLLLEAARIDLDAGRIPQARAKALEALRASKQFGVMDDRPELILAQIENATAGSAAQTTTKPKKLPVLSTVPPPLLAQADPVTVPESGNSTAVIKSPPNAISGKPAFANSPQPITAPPNETLESDVNSEPHRHKDLIAKADANGTPSTTDAASFDSLTFLIGIFASFGVLSAGWLLVSMARRAVAEKAKPESKPETRRQRLEKLLRGDLPVDMLPVAIPTDLEFFGLPTEEKSLRLDESAAGQKPARPHFADRVAITPKPPVTETTQSAGMPMPPAGRTILRSDPAQQTPSHHTTADKPSVLDRVLSRVHEQETR